jgi:hypothetical protein
METKIVADESDPCLDTVPYHYVDTHSLHCDHHHCDHIGGITIAIDIEVTWQ